MAVCAAVTAQQSGADRSLIVASDSAEPITYRRLFVPGEHPEAWPLADEKFIPIEAREFQELISAANRQPNIAASRASIVEAVYSGRSQGDGTLAGRGTWRIELHSDSPEVLPLRKLPFTIREPHWQGQSMAPARIGFWGRSGESADSFGLYVPQSGIFEFEWRIELNNLASDSERAWRLPPAAVSRLTLDLPVSHRLNVEGGVVLESSSPPESPTTNDETRRWIIALGGSADAGVRIVTAGGASQEPTSDIRLQEETAYRVDDRGVHLATTLRCEGSISRLRELVVPIPAGVQFLSAAAGGNELDWKLLTHGAANSVAVAIELPEIDSLDQLSVTLRAWHAFPTNREWRLPALRPEGMFWTSGTLELSVAPMIELHQLMPVDCMQTGVVASTGDDTGAETHWFTAYSPAAALDVTVARRAAKASARLASSLSITEPAIDGRLTTKLEVARGSIPKLNGQLAPGWIVEAVETTPESALGEWFVNRRGEANEIEIQFLEPPNSRRNVTIRIDCRLGSASFADPITVGTLRMVRWRDVDVAEHLLSFHAVEPYSAEPVADLPSATPQQLASASLLDDETEAAFDLMRAPKNAALRITLERGEFEADVTLHAAIVQNETRLAYQLQVRPVKSRIDRLLVFANAPLGADVRWTDRGTGAALVAERLATTDPPPENVPVDGEIWSVRLPQPTARPVEIIAELTHKLSGRQPLPLISLPRAVGQSGKVNLSCDSARLPELEPLRLQPVPVPLATAEGTSNRNTERVFAAYRYSPADCADVARCPQLWLANAQAQSVDRVIVPWADLTTFFSAAGRALHRAVYYLEDSEDVVLSLPGGAENAMVFLNNVSLPLSQSSPGSRQSFKLPKHSSAASLRVQFDTVHPPLVAGSRLRPSLVEGIAVLFGDWTVKLPSEFEVTSSSQWQIDGGFNWRQRLFGPLGRSDNSRPFDPFRVAGRDLPAPAEFEPSLGLSIASLSPDIAISATAQASPAVNGGGVAALEGWRSYRTSFIGQGPRPLVVGHPPVLTAGAVSAFLLCFVVGRGIARRNHELYVALLAVLAGAALLLPSPVVSLATGAFLGLVFSLALVERNPLPTDDSPTKTWNRLTAGIVVLAVGTLFAKSSLGQQPEILPTNEANESPASGTRTELNGLVNGDSAAVPRTIHRVLIPSDKRGQAVGNKHYVAEKLLRRLFALANNDATASEWLMLDASCEAELTDQSNSNEMVSAQWKLVFDIEALARDTTIVLPLRRDEANWQETAFLDGLPATIHWLADGRGCTLLVAEPGRYTLVIACQPEIAQLGDRNQIEMTVPATRGGRFQLRHPAEMADVELTGVSTVQDIQSRNPLIGELDGSGRIAVRWPQRPVPPGESPGLRVTQLEWLHVAEDYVELNAKFILEGGVRRPESFSIDIDGPWQLTAADNLISNEPSGADRRTVRVAIPPDDIDRQEVNLQWQLENAAPLGLMIGPEIELTSVPVTQRWVAASSDSALLCEFVGAATANLGIAQEFAARWGGGFASDNVDVVLTEPRSDGAIVVSIRPRLTQATISESLRVAAGQEGLRLHYHADVNPNSRTQYQATLIGSDGVEIDKVVLTRGARQVPVRWCRGQNNLVTIFFSEAQVDPYRLTVTGHVTHDESGTYRIPRIAASPVAAAQRVQFYRDEQMLLESQGISEVDQPADRAAEVATSPLRDRFVGAYSLSSASFSTGRLIVTPNDTHLSGTTLTEIERESDAWWAEFVCQLVVDQGRLGTLELRAPAEWSGPLELQSELPATAEISVNDSQQPSIAVRFTDPVPANKEFQLRLRGPLALAANNQVAVPEIVVHNQFNGRHYIVVPSAEESWPITWTQQGVRPIELPFDLAAVSPGATNGKAFEIASRPMRVAMQPRPADAATATVRLADTLVTVGPFSGHVTVAHFVVVSSGLTECVLELPRTSELVHVSAEGRRTSARQLDDRRWFIPLGVANLPQLVEIVTRSSESSSSTSPGSIELSRPVLYHDGKPLPVEVSLWSVGLPKRWAQHSVSGAAAVSEAEHAALKLDRLSGVVESATRSAIELPLPDGRNWYVPWARRLATLRQKSMATIRQPATDGPMVQVDSAAEEQLTDAAERLETWLEQCDQIWEDPQTDRSAAASKMAAERSTRDLAQSAAPDWIYCVADGDAAQLKLNAESSLSPAQAKVGGLLMIAAIATGTIAIMRWPAGREFACRWPQAILFLAGLAYWAFLWPSILGLVIAAGSVWLAMRPGWPGRSTRLEHSTVIRVPQSNRN
jgi:hypothetical protein